MTRPCHATTSAAGGMPSSSRAVGRSTAYQVSRSIGLKMRQMADDWGDFCTRAGLAVELELLTGLELTDQETEAVRTLRELARVIEPRLPAGGDRVELAEALVREAARGVLGSRAGAAVVFSTTSSRLIPIASIFDMTCGSVMESGSDTLYRWRSVLSVSG